jgi:hypothetical protein
MTIRNIWRRQFVKVTVKPNVINALKDEKVRS